MSNIVPIKEARQTRLRRALDEWHKANDQWIEKTLALAIELREARDESEGDDRAFGQWLVDNDCDDLGKNDRAALIKLADHVELARQVLQETKRRSVQYIWLEEIKPLISPYVRTDTPSERPEVEPLVIDTQPTGTKTPTQRRGNYVAALRKFSEATTTAIACAGGFRPADVSLAVGLIDEIVADLNRLRLELRADVR